MKVLMCGSRDWNAWEPIQKVFDMLPKDTIVVEGECRGADRMCRDEAKRRGMKVRPYPAKWNEYDKAAGHIRNTQMLTEEDPDLGVAFHDNLLASKGTFDMVRKLLNAGKRVLHVMSDGSKEWL